MANPFGDTGKNPFGDSVAVDLDLSEPRKAPPTGRLSFSFGSAPPVTPPAQVEPQSEVERYVQMYHEGKLNPRFKAILEELATRGRVNLTKPNAQQPFQTIASINEAERKGMMQELAKDTGFFNAIGISAGKVFTDMGRAVGIGDSADQTEKESIKALQSERPVATAIGESLPFLPAAVATGGITATLPRVMASGALGALEGGIIADDSTKGAMVGGATGLGAEILFPIVGRLGRKVFQRVTGKMPKGAMLTPNGRPTPELQQALDASGVKFEDLTQDAIEFIGKAEPGANPSQLVRAAEFEQMGIPATKGDITQNFAQQSTEQRLATSVTNDAAEPLRQYKLKQSQAIEKVLTDLGGEGYGKEQTGELVKGALEGRYKLLRSKKTELYEDFASKASENNLGDIPLITGTIDSVLPDARKIRNLDRASKGAVSDGMDILAEYGLAEPTERMIKSAAKDADGNPIIETIPLTIQNYDDLQQSLKFLIRGDQSGAASVAFKDVIDLVENEADELANVLAKSGKVSAEVLAPLRKARAVTRTLKTEFAPQSISAKLINAKKNGGEAMVTEASRVYDTLTGAGSKVEDARRIVKSLMRSDDGKEALGALQSTVLLDLIDAGFTTKSRKIAGENVFNPVAFQNKLNKLNKDGKINAIFSNAPEVLAKIKNINRIATYITPPADAVPKGSAAVIMDLMNNLAVSKIPGGSFALGMLKQVTEPVKTGMEVKKALKGIPDAETTRSIIEKQFPSLSVALGIPALVGDKNE